MSMGGDDPIIIYKKKKGHGGGHHGGGWKVAYADFVTAMMAFFMVMWIVGMESNTKDLVEGYFNNPIGFRQAYGAGLDPVSRGMTPIATEINRMPVFIRQVEQRRFNTVRDGILEQLGGVTGAEEFGSQVEVLVTPDGLRIELREGQGGGTFFESGSDGVQVAAEQALRIIAENVQALPNHVVIEGHTDAAPFGTGEYTNWELSVDRANAARRLLIESGLSPDKIDEVRGYADRAPLFPNNPLDPSNRRVTILVPFVEFFDSSDQLGAGDVTGSEDPTGN